MYVCVPELIPVATRCLPVDGEPALGRVLTRVALRSESQEGSVADTCEWMSHIWESAVSGDWLSVKHTGQRHRGWL